MPGETFYETPTFHPTGEYRLRPEGDRIVLQLREATRPMSRPASRWRDATPQDVFRLVRVGVSADAVKVEV